MKASENEASYIVRSTARVLGIALMVVLIVVLTWYGTKFLSHALAIIRYPFQLFGSSEGTILNQTKLLLSGKTIYRPINGPPHTISPYPPVYYLTTGAVDWFVRDTLAAGRIVSVTSTMLIPVVLGCLIWRALGSEGDLLTRGLASVTGGMAFLSTIHAQRFGPLMRMDMLAVLFAFAGVLAFVAWANHPRRIYWSLLLFVLGAYTKQSTLAGPLSCLVVALSVRPALGLKLAGVLAAVGLGIFSVINVLTSGQFYFHLVTANAVAFSWDRGIGYLLRFIRYYPVFFTISLLSTIMLLMTQWQTLRSQWSKSRDDAITEDFSWERPVIGLYWIAALLTTLTAGRVGSSTNYLIEFMGVVCMCVGIASAWPLDALSRALQRGSNQRRRGSYQRLAVSILALVLPGLLIWQVARPGRWRWLQAPQSAERLMMERVLGLIKQANGPVLSEDMTLLALAGKRVEFDHYMTQLAYKKIWDQSKFLRRIYNKEFDLVVLEFDIYAFRNEKYERFSPEMISALRQNYELAVIEGDLRVYKPR